MELSRLASALRSMVRGRVTVNEPLKPLTTIRIGGPADLLVAPADEDDLLAALAWAREHRLPWHILGAGSNLLVPDEGLRGLVLRTRPALDTLRFDGRRVLVGTGASVARLVGQAARLGLKGLEGLAGVPGSVGGALAMNAGTRAGDIGSRVEWVRVVDEQGRVRELSREELAFGYRTSRLQQERWLALSACLVLEPGDSQTIRARVDEALRYRNETQPLQWPNAGSIFKNPPGDAAGRLIDAAGCKGWRRGDAQVSDLHANWIINLGDARADDVVALMVAVVQAVWSRFGLVLEPEIRLLGHLADDWRHAVDRLDQTPGSPA